MAYLIIKCCVLILVLLVVPHTASFILNVIVEPDSGTKENNPCQYTIRGNVQHHYSCDIYYECKKSRPVLKYCPPRNQYKSDLKLCYPEKFVVCPSTSMTAKDKSKPHPPPISPNCQPIIDIRETMFHREHKLNKNNYYISKDVYVSDKVSMAVCHSICGYLAEVNGLKEKFFIQDFLLESSGNHGALVAGTDVLKNNHWVFQRTSKPVSYLPWNNKRLNNDGKHCLAYQINKDRFDLYKVACRNRHGGL